MADTLLQICQDIADETGVQSPIAVMSSNVENARRMRGHALRAARYVARSHDWQALESVATITTVATQQAYARPADFKSWLPNTHWDNTNYQPMEGPVSGPRFEALNRSQLASAGVFTRFFRLRGNQVLIYPVPSTSGETLTYPLSVERAGSGYGRHDGENPVHGGHRYRSHPRGAVQTVPSVVFPRSDGRGLCRHAA